MLANVAATFASTSFEMKLRFQYSKIFWAVNNSLDHMISWLWWPPGLFVGHAK